MCVCGMFILVCPDSCWAQRASSWTYTEGFNMKLNMSEYETHILHPTCVKIKNKWNYTFTPPPSVHNTQRFSFNSTRQWAWYGYAMCAQQEGHKYRINIIINIVFWICNSFCLPLSLLWVLHEFFNRNNVIILERNINSWVTSTGK
jgi:hypothetical protein